MAVEDSNDNIPYFTSTVYDAVAYESSPIGTSVIQVTALDKDNGINGQLTYTLEAGVMLSGSKLVSCFSFLALTTGLNCDWLFNALSEENKLGSLFTSNDVCNPSAAFR